MRTSLRYTVLTGLLLLSTIFAHAQMGSSANGNAAGQQSVSRALNRVQIDLEGQELPVPSQLNLWLQQALNTAQNHTWSLVRSEKDQQGITHTRFQQQLNGVPVEGGILQLHSRGRKGLTLNGYFFAPTQPEVTPSLTESAALQLALDHTQATKYMWEIPQEEAALKRRTGQADATYFPKGELVVANDGTHFRQQDFKLLWKFDINTAVPHNHTEVYVDAQTGTIFQEIDQFTHANAPGTAQTHYSGNQSITTDYNSGQFRLRETVRGQGIETYNLAQTINFWAATDFVDNDNQWTNVNAQRDEVATDAHWGAEKTYDYFFSQFGRNSIDGAGYKLEGYVHYNTNYNNAFWDGSRMIYGDGDGITWNPVVCLDAVGHEISHGLTQYTSGLDTRNEAGALNEALSDIFAVAIDFYARPLQANWLIAEEATVSGTGIRDLTNPAALGHPDTYLGTNWDVSMNDIHSNSTVISHCFYLMANGGSGTNDLGDPYAVVGIGLDKAAAIAYQLNTYYLSTFSDFNDARALSIQAAIDLYGACSAEVFACADAWYAIGVGPIYTGAVSSGFSALANEYCQAPAHVRFQNTSVNADSFRWDFGDGTFSSQRNPLHTYTATGNYTVSVIAFGGPCGNDTTVLTNYIKVDPNLPCNVVLDPQNQNTTQYGCSGTLTDPGAGGDYPQQSVSFLTIAPTGATSITLSFSQFDYRSGDTLRIYDGPNFSSPLLGKYSGNNLPAGGTITSTTGQVTILHRSDPYLGAPGFNLTWTCNGASGPIPVPAFNVSNPTPCRQSVQFTDLSSGNPTSWLWDFGDGNTSTLQNPTHNYRFMGSYTVKLVVGNAAGQDSLIAQNLITVNMPVTLVLPGQANTLCQGTPISLGGGGSSLTWNGTGSQPNGLSAANRGNRATLGLSSTGCRDTTPAGPASRAPLRAPGSTSSSEVNHDESSYSGAQNALPEELTHTSSSLITQPDITPAATEPPTITRMTSWPNPFGQRLNVSAELARTGTLTLTLTDLMGRPIKVLFQGEAAAGAFSWNGEIDPQLAGGLYLVHLQQGATRVTQRVVHTR